MENRYEKGFFDKLADDIEKAEEEIKRLRFDVNSCTVLATAILSRTRAGGDKRSAIQTLSSTVNNIMDKAQKNMGISMADRDGARRITESILNALEDLEKEEQKMNPQYKPLIENYR